MERSLKQHVFHRDGIQQLGTTTVKSFKKIMEVERILMKNIELIPCPTAIGGKTSIRDICIKTNDVLPIDLELMNYLFKIPDFFFYLMEKAGINKHEREITILCNGTTLYLGEIPTYKILLRYEAGQNNLELNTVGKNYWGKLPSMYQLVYRLPKAEAYLMQRVA